MQCVLEIRPRSASAVLNVSIVLEDESAVPCDANVTVEFGHRSGEMPLEDLHDLSGFTLPFSTHVQISSDDGHAEGEEWESGELSLEELSYPDGIEEWDLFIDGTVSQAAETLCDELDGRFARVVCDYSGLMTELRSQLAE